MTEVHHACTPTLEHLLAAEKILETHNEDPIVSSRSAVETDSEFVSACWPRVGRTRLLVASKRFIGLGAAEMRDGVWVLPRAGAMFILRNCDDDGDDMQYVFIGEAYAHGVMDGEAADGRR